MIVKRDLGLRLTVSEFHHSESRQYTLRITKIPGESDPGPSVSFPTGSSDPGCDPGERGDNYLLPDWSDGRGDSGEGDLPRVLGLGFGPPAEL